MGNKGAKYQCLREKCNDMSNIIFEIKLEIANVSKRAELVKDLLDKLRECRNEIDDLLKMNLNNTTNENLRQIKKILSANDFTDLKLNLSLDDLKIKLNNALDSLNTVCDAIDRVEEINSFAAKLKSFMSDIGSFLTTGVVMVGHVAMKAIKP
jgi:hypothetical protein